MTTARCGMLLAWSVSVVMLFSPALTSPTRQNDQVHALLDATDLNDQAAAQQLFQTWGTTHVKNYASKSDQQKAMQNLLDNAKKVKTNRQAGNTTHALALNEFADMSFTDFKKARLGLVKSRTIKPNTAGAKHKRQIVPALPPSVNWTALGYVTPVKNQGDCGCCWTFASTGALEGQYFKKFGQLISFSEQEFIECVTDYRGCDGGDMTVAFDYVAQTSGGLATRANYPYVAQDGKTFGACKTSTIQQVKMKPTYTFLENDQQILAALASSGPLPAAVSVNDNFMLYQSGIMDPSSNCGPPADVNHSVLIVGYGTDPVTGLTYWLIKNSWGTGWGENGYLRLLRAVADSCGIAEYAFQLALS